MEKLFPCMIWQRRRGSAAPSVARPWRFDSCLLLRLWDMLLSINPGQAIGEDSIPAGRGQDLPASKRQDSHALETKDELPWSVAAAMEEEGM